MLIEYYCCGCNKGVTAKITDDSIESPEEIDLTNTLCDECEKKSKEINRKFPRYSEFAQCECDRCGSFVGITGLFLIWPLVEDGDYLEFKPKLVCKSCLDYWECLNSRRIENPEYCQGCGCGVDETLLTEYWDSESKSWYWLCEDCAKDGGYWEEY